MEADVQSRFEGHLRKLRYLLVSVGVIVLDQWTKWLVELHLPHHMAETVIPGFINLTHVRNTGVAFGLFASDGGSGWLLTVLGRKDGGGASGETPPPRNRYLNALSAFFWKLDRMLLASPGFWMTSWSAEPQSFARLPGSWSEPSKLTYFAVEICFDSARTSEFG